MNNQQRIIRFDWAIKKLLRNKASFVILEGLLYELLHQEVKIKELLESESNKETADDKQNRVDLLALTGDGDLILVEVQVSLMQDYLQRMLYGASRLIIDHMKEGMAYDKVKKVISLNIVFFELGVGTDYVYYGTTQFRGLHNKDILQLTHTQKELFGEDTIAALFPEYYLLRVGRLEDDSVHNGLDEWIYVLKNSSVPDDFTARGLEEMREQLAVVKMTDEELQAYQSYLHTSRRLESEARSRYIDDLEKSRAEGREEGKAEGREEGAHHKAVEIAKAMKINGIATETIVMVTGLSKEEIVML